MCIAEFQQLREERKRINDEYLNYGIGESKDSIMNINVRKKENRMIGRSLAETKGVDPHSEEGVAMNTAADYVS